MSINMTKREELLTIYYAELNAKIQAMQNQQTYLKTQLDVFVKPSTATINNAQEPLPGRRSDIP